MLTILNNYQHGLVVIPVVLACKKHGLFQMCRASGPLSFDVLVKELRANSGHLRVALHLLASIQWLSRDAADRYALTPQSELHRHIPEDIIGLLSFPMQDYLSGRGDHYSLKKWVDLSGRRWNIHDAMMAQFLDGPLMIPLLLALRAHSLSEELGSHGTSLFAALHPVAREEIIALFAGKGWLDRADRPMAMGSPALNDAGRFMIERSLITATLASYRPMLTNMSEVIFGHCEAVFMRDATGHETHVDRTLNVIGSGFQHERYFEQMEEIILAVFNRAPYEKQPLYVADMGCGDGTLLRKIYDLIKAKSLRGKVLDTYPVKLIGIDYNAQALEATARTLSGYDYLVLQGDIGDPVRMIEDLRDQGIQDPENILHVRSFLDHDRPYKPPLDTAAAEARTHIAYNGVYVDRQGNGIPPAAVVQSLVEHLKRWSSILGNHGLLLLEVHCLDPKTIARFMQQSESLHVDAYNRFSQQFLVEADRFMMAAAEAGLFPDWELFRKYPKRLPFTRITLSWLQKCDYTMRHPSEGDIPALAAFEARCLPASQAASAEEIRERVTRYPEGQCLLEVDGQPVAVAYSQRVLSERSSAEPLSTAKTSWAHVDDGAVAELLYALCPSAEHKKRGHDLIAFMANCLALKDGIEAVIGVSRCERDLELAGHGRQTMMATIQDYVKGYAISPEEDTLAPESELSTFGLRWLLRIFQDMGVMSTPDQVYNSKDLCRRLGIIPKYERLCAALVRLLEREQVLLVTGERIKVMPRAATFALRDVDAERQRFAAAFQEKYATLQPFLELMCRCLNQFAAVITGRVEVNDVIFPDGSMDVFSGIFRGNRVAEYFNNLVAEIVLAKIRLTRQQASETSLSILEVGAGTGSTTRVVLEKIQHLSSAVSFFYTDISSSFTRYGERSFGQQFPWVKFARLNIEEDPASQGFDHEGFDIVYAANVLHDTRSIANTLSQVKTLLKPGALLILNEFTAMKDVLLFTGGLLHGYWLFEDPEIRLQDSCLLSVDRWQEALRTSGFQHVEAIGLPFEATRYRQSVIVCEKDGALSECSQSTPAMTDQDCALKIEEAVREIIGPQRMESLSSDRPLMESGIDSMELMELRMLLGKKFAVDLDATFLFEQNTLQKVCAFFQHDAQSVQNHSHLEHPHETAQPENVIFHAATPTENHDRQGDIALIGVALRFPGQVHTLVDFWTLLKDGKTAVGTRPEARWPWPSSLVAVGEKPSLTKGGFLHRIDAFDAPFFRISPREAELMDPQQRMLLELCWEVMEDAGYKPSSLSGSDTGVFIGACHFDYRKLLEDQGLAAEALASTGTSGSILANRLSYFYNFQGPSLLVDTACSSSLVAVHEAVRELRHGSCEQALVGGVNLICHAMTSLSYHKAGMLSLDGTCYTFDARANGYVRGEGAALLFLKRLDKAIQDNDRIYAVIKGSATNHGGQASSLTAPNPEAQARLIAKAWQDGGITADSVTYIETHGTGTPLGDPIEVQGIRQALTQSYPDGTQARTCGLGSVKSNIGHLEGAAGIAGLIKVLLCLQHQTLPKSINFRQLNPEIKLTAPLYIVDKTQPWQPLRDQTGKGLPRRTGVSSFGFGGANAHIVLEEYAQKAGDHCFAGPYLFVLSARNRDRLLAYAERFLAFLERPEAEALSLAGMTYTLQNCREEMNERLAILCTDLAQLREKLQLFGAGQQTSSNLYHGNAQRSASDHVLLTDGPAGRKFIENLIQEKDYERLALLWIKGCRIEWPAIFGHQPPDKVRLPTYPFAQERYWLPTTTVEEASPSSKPDRREPALAEPTSHLAHPHAVATDHAGHDAHSLLLTPVWAPVSHIQSQARQPFPAAADHVAIVDSYRQDTGEESTIYCHALQQRYPEAQLLRIRSEEAVASMARKFEALADRLGGAVDHIFWITPGPRVNSAPMARQDLVEDQRQGVLGLFRMIKVLLRAGYGNRALGWTVVTTRTQPIHQDETVDPTHAGVHGLIGSLAKEFPHWKICLVDLEPPRGTNGRLLELPFDDLLVLPPDPEGNAWAYRRSANGVPQWFRQQLVPVTSPAISHSLYRSGGVGVYVVIGGAGGVGEVWSEYMIRTYGARLVWINRRPKDQVVQAKLDRLAPLGPTPHYISADAADEAALRCAYEEIKARYGQINGVVHAAVVLHDQSLANMDEARFRAGLAAKVDTSMQMARVFQQEPLDFALFFSSIMTFVKPPGQANYAAGCTFMDAFAHQLGREWSRPQGGPLVKVMHWGYWGGVGVAAPEIYRERMARAGFGSIDPAQAMAALEGLLAGPLDRLVLIKTVEPAMARPLGASPLFNIISTSERVTVVPQTHPTPAARHNLPQHLDRSANATTTRPAESWTEAGTVDTRGDHLLDRVLANVVRAASRALEVEPEDLDADVDLHEYGFDTVSLAHMIHELNHVCGLDGDGPNLGRRPLTSDDVLEHRGGQAPTLRGVAMFLLDKYGDTLLKAFPPGPATSPQVRAVDAVSNPAETVTDPAAHVKTMILDCLARALKTPVAAIDDDVPFSEYGLDSILITGFVVDVNNRLGIAMHEAIVFDHTTVNRLTRHVVQTYGADLEHARRAAAEALQNIQPPATVGHQHAPAWPTILTSEPGRESRSVPVDTTGARSDNPEVKATDIAVIGMSGQFPDAGDLHRFWENLMAGRDCVHELPAHYLDQAAFFSAEKQPGKTYSRWGGMLQDRDCFDPLFFNISPREARSMSPHQRLILQESWKSLEDAGYNPKDLAEARVGVFIGAEPAEYFHETFTGASDAIIASRLSYYLNLRGPAMVVNTACSSSGVALHLACESLRHGESSMALAGGVFVLTDESLLVKLSAMDMLSPTGRCHTFDTRGDGMVLSEGVGVVVLKRLQDAIADGDPILGVIQGSGVNQDGASNGITAPSGVAQEELVTSVYERFQINPEEISYVEAHGTGTRLGDPVEANALVRAFRRFTDKQGFCAVGSVKATIGHTAASAGVVSLIKVLLCLKHRTIPGLVGLEHLNPLIEFDNTPFYVNTRPGPWDTTDGKPLMAALSSFGHSGTNAHLVIREYLRTPQLPAPRVNGSAPVFIPLSARTAARLTAYAEHLWSFLSSAAGRDVDLADVAHTLQVGREAMKERVLFLVRDIPELLAKLKDFIAGKPSIDCCWVGRADRNPETLPFLADDEDSRDMLARWVAKGEYEKIAELWTRGDTLDWRLLDSEGYASARRPRRISLPTYPFAKERYWATGSTPAATGARPPSQLTRGEQADAQLDQPVPPHIYPETIPTVLSAIKKPLPIDDTRVAHILANGELLDCEMDDLLCKLFWGTLQSLGLCRGDTLLYAHFEGIAGIDKKYGRWCEESLNMLVAMGYLDKARDAYRVLDLRAVDMDVLWREWDHQKAIWSWDVSKRHQAALVDTTLRFLPHILTGRRKVTDFLFPNSSMELVESIYKHNLVADFFNEALADSLVAYLDQRLRDRTADDLLRIRILEIGAGTGGTTAVVLPRLQPFLDHIQEYCYTDLSNAFLIHAQKEYALDHPFLKTRIFNMEAPLAELDIERGAYDVVIATNVLHAARNVRQPLRNTKAILKKHGLLLLNEMSSKPKPFFIHLSLALLDGWWRYEDAELRIPGCPGLFPHTWERVLREEGFLSAFFPVEKAHMLSQQIVMAESDGICRPRQHACDGFPSGGERKEATHHDPLEAVLVRAGNSTRLDEHVKVTIIESLSESLGVDMGVVDMDEPFADYGLDSITAVNLVQVLNRAFRLHHAAQPLDTTMLFDHGSVKQLAAYVVSHYGSVIVTTLDGETMPMLETTPSLSTPVALEEPHPPAPPAGPHDPGDGIAVIGMSGRFAGSETLEAFWQHLIMGTDLVKEVSRWDLAPYFPGTSPEPRTYCNHGSFLDHIDQFDPLFFKISALEAKYMDPQQRFFLEESWKALEDAGYAGDTTRGGRCGVYVGCISGDYEKLFRQEPPEQAFWGNAGSIIPARIAYYLDLQGPAIAVDTACSSSAVAIHLACQALLSGEIDMALAGGVYIQSTPGLYIAGSRAGMLSLTGRCFTFDQRADGFVPGEGVGVLMLKRLRDALADGDHIHGVIRGSGINQDGTTNGITAPSAKSQERLEREVYERFKINPEQLQMIEAHGTGTILGDPIEVEALTRAFRHYTDKEAYCAIGTLKTNIGHTSMAAGVAGVLKILLALKHQQIPPSLNYASANPRIALEHSPFYVNSHPRPWTVDDNAIRCAATSSFGFSGTNAHLVIEEAPRVERRHAPRPGYLFVLSARTAEQLRHRAEDLLAFCERDPGVDLGNMCYTLLLGRSHLHHRLACVVHNLAELVRYLRTWLEKGSLLQVYVAQLPEGQQRERASLTRYGNQCIQACQHADDAGEYLEHLATMADLYIQGYRLDFGQLFSDGYTRLPLPTYPFARESYWAPAAALPDPIGAPSAVHSTSAPPAVIHSLLHRNTSDFTAQRFSSHFSGRESFLADHWIAGRQVLPGVVQLEMARAAAVAAAGLRPGNGLRLCDVIWAHPVVVDASNREIHVGLVPQARGNDGAGEADRVRYEIFTEPRAGERLVHCQGTVSLSAPTGASTLDLAALQTRINRLRLSAAQCYEIFRPLGIRHGPSLQGLDEVFCGDDQVLARLRPPAVVGDLVMHPAMLDAALQASFFLLMEEGDTEIRLPFALAELKLFRPDVTPAWAWLRRASKAGQLDIDLCDEQGNVSIRLKGLSFRARAEKPTTAQALLLEPCWEERATEQGTGRFDRHLVVLCEMDNLSRQHIEAGLEGCRCLMLPAADRPIEERFQHHAVRVFDTVRELIEQDTGATTLLQVVCPVQGPERVFAALAGFLHIANQEHSRFTGQLLEIDPGEANLVASLREGSRFLADTHVRYLHGQRSVASWRPLDGAGREPSSPWKSGGTYLITGGLGGLGLIFAQDIATRAKDSTLILVGRSPLAQNGRVLEALRGLGARVEYRQVDVTSADQINDLIRHIREQAGSRTGGPGVNGPLQGILHAAGVHHDNRIIKKAAEEFARVLGPKVAGTANLDRATCDLDLDFFVLFSSIAVAIGNPGQADYATANAFMDAYAAWRNGLVASGQRRGHTLSINWPLWLEGRMRADRDIERMVAQRTGLVGMESPVGIRALALALGAGKDQVMVLNGDRHKLYTALSAARTGSDTANTGTPTTPQQNGLPDAETPDLRQKGHDYLKKQIAAVVELPPHRIDVDAPLDQYGFDSILLVKMTNILEESFGTLSKTLLFEYQNIRELTTYFLENCPDKLRSLLGTSLGEVVTPSPWQGEGGGEGHAGLRLVPLTQTLSPTGGEGKECDTSPSQLLGTDVPGAHFGAPTPDPANGVTDNTAGLNRSAHASRRPITAAPSQPGVREPVDTDLAVIGLTGRYPQACNIAEFWENLKNGKDCITEIPRERLDHERYYDPDKDKPGKVYFKWGGFIDGVDQFDPLFFNISPRVATLMDPQERLFLETVWNLFEETGHTRKRLQQRYEGKVGVFVGAMHQQYLLFDTEPDSAATISLSTHSALANRVSYFFNLHGPSLAIDTMCSASLTAVHTACESLRRGECSLAVAGGANFSLHPKKFMGLSRTRTVASQPDRRSFGDGDGLLPADGVGAVLLKPLSRALLDGDEILAVIKSTATNHGGYANGFYVPNPQAQAQLIIDNFEKSGVDPRTISYVESAANGSSLADPIEVTALTKAFARFTPDRGFCAIGSVKSNIGHPEAASGMAQLAKVILQLRHRQLVPSIKAHPLNPNISFADTPFYLQETLREWQRPRIEVIDSDGRRVAREVPRRATISSFGAGGSNAHLIIEEYVAESRPAEARSARAAAPQIVVFSAKSLERLQAVVRQMRDFLVAAEPAPGLADLAYTLQVGREAMTSRLAMVVRDWTELLRGLTAFLEAPGNPESAAIPRFAGDTEEHEGIGDLLASEAVRQVLVNERDLEKLALYWTRGGEIPWEVLHEGEHPRLITLPTYPFARQRYWLAASAAEPQVEHTIEPTLAPQTPAGTDHERVWAFLLHFLSRELSLTPDQVRPHRDLHHHGADSITTMRLRRAVEEAFQVHITGRDLLKHRTIHALSTYLAARLDGAQAAGDAGVSPAPDAFPPPPLEEGTKDTPQTEGRKGLAPMQPVPPDALDQFKQGLLTLEDMEALLDQGEMV